MAHTRVVAAPRGDAYVARDTALKQGVPWIVVDAIVSDSRDFEIG